MAGTVCRARPLPTVRNGNPVVEITNPFDYRGRSAEIIPSTSEKWGRASNDIREKLLSGREAGDIYVRVIRSYCHFEDGDLVAVCFNKKGNGEKSGFDITPDEAFSVLRGFQVFYGRCLFRSEKKGDLALRVWADGDYGARKGFGFIGPSGNRRFLSRRKKKADSIITSEIVEALSPGDCLIARQVGFDIKTETRFFEPVVNFDLWDVALSPEGKQLITSVDGYQAGDKIRNLPIVSSREDKKRMGIFGVGYVPREESDPNGFYYKPVWVVGAGDEKGKYVSSAKIRHNGEKVLIAEKTG